jgi:uncharacterized protein (DUF1778 family)
VPITKTEVVSVRAPPRVKIALAAAAEVERRSLATRIEGRVLDYSKMHESRRHRPQSANQAGQRGRRTSLVWTGVCVDEQKTRLDNRMNQDHQIILLTAAGILRPSTTS